MELNNWVRKNSQAEYLLPYDGGNRFRKATILPVPQYEAKQAPYKMATQCIDNNGPRIVLYPFLDR